MHSGDGVVLGEMRRRGTWRLSGQGNGKKKKKKISRTARWEPDSGLGERSRKSGVWTVVV